MAERKDLLKIPTFPATFQPCFFSLGLTPLEPRLSPFRTRHKRITLRTVLLLGEGSNCVVVPAMKCDTSQFRTMQEASG